MTISKEEALKRFNYLENKIYNLNPDTIVLSRHIMLDALKEIKDYIENSEVNK